jgi:hypothetical protein
MTRVAFAIACVLLAAPVFAQGPPDARWEPWLGCWQVEADAPIGPRRPSGRVCVAAEGTGVTITTTPTGGAPMTQRLVADDVARPITDGPCTGTEQSQWSDDGYRLYSRAALTCAGGERRQVSGISLLAPDGTWIEAQAIEIGVRSSVRVRRFTKDGGPPVTPARGRLTLAQVKDVSRHVAAPALEAALVEARATFGLTRDSLVALDEAGVPSSVIDVMVALTYPQAFAIHPASRADRLTAFPFEADPVDSAGLWWPGSLVGGYYNSAYLLSPFGYTAFGAYPVFFGVDAGGGGMSNRPEPRPAETGRVVNGRGYTRLAPRRAEDAGSDAAAGTGAASGRAAVTRGGYTRGDSGASSAGSGAASGSSGGGSSSSGGGGGRSAVDR